MAKTNNLKDYLTDLYEGIASKKPNASRNPQNFRSEIESIVTGIDGVEASNNDTEITITKSKSALYVDADIDYIGLEHNAYVVIDSEDGSNEVEIDMNSGKVIAENLEPQNIAKDVNILGVVGTYEGGSSEDYLEQLNNNTLTSYSNSNITAVRAYMFYCNTTLTSINLPLVSSVGTKCFYNCSNLEIVNLPLAKNIGTQAFYLDNLLTDVYLGYGGVVTLSSTSAFTSAGTTQGYINVHVRSEYADQYATATNWSSLIADGTIVIVGDYSD